MLGDMLNNVLGSGKVNFNQEQSATAQALGEELQDPNSGGLEGVLNNFRQAGMSDKVDSWVSTGENQPVDEHQVSQALGQDRVQRIAQRAGIPASIASGALAYVLPMLVNHLTPNGQIPQGGFGGALGGLLGMLGQKRAS